MKYVRYRTADGGSYTGILSRDEKIISLGQLDERYVEMLKETTSYRLARKIAEADFPGRETLKRVLGKRV